VWLASREPNTSLSSCQASLICLLSLVGGCQEEKRYFHFLFFSSLPKAMAPGSPICVEHYHVTVYCLLLLLLHGALSLSAHDDDSDGSTSLGAAAGEASALPLHLAVGFSSPNPSE
jgi:hypothetical protein